MDNHTIKDRIKSQIKLNLSLMNLIFQRWKRR